MDVRHVYAAGKIGCGVPFRLCNAERERLVAEDLGFVSGKYPNAEFTSHDAEALGVSVSVIAFSEMELLEDYTPRFSTKRADPV